MQGGRALACASIARAAAYRGMGSDAAIGNHNVKADPTPTSLVAVTSPPINRAN
jgi:hypothetical protein